MKKLTLITLFFIISSCVSEERSRFANGAKERESNIEKSTGERYRSTNDFDLDIEIIKIRDCEYVLWHNSYGSDMEHYEGCENTKHK